MDERIQNLFKNEKKKSFRFGLALCIYATATLYCESHDCEKLIRKLNLLLNERDFIV